MQHVSCDGAPRDLGLDQGRACRDAIRADARALGWRPSRPGLLGRCRAWLAPPSAPAARPRPALARDLARHFPHLDERTRGLAKGAALPHAALLVLLEEELADAPLVGAGVARRDGAPCLVLRLRTPLPPTGLVAREARPDGGYPFLALTRPALPAALAGVNARGLAGVVAELDPPASRGRGRDRCTASAALLLDQCLERLDGVEPALEWCERRPAGGRARLLFADAAGAVGAIAIDGDTRTRCDVPSAETGEAGARVLVDPAARSLELHGAGAAPERAAIAAAAWR
jgi:hypothetical protein